MAYSGRDPLEESEPLDFKRLPKLSRHTFRIELVHTALWRGFVAVLEGGVASVVAAKTFNGSPALVALVAAAPFYTNMFSLVWGMMALTRPKIPLMTMLCSGAALVAATIAATPAGSPWAGWIFAAQMILARIFISGVITVRTAIWKANYPERVRGRLAARVQLVGNITGLASVVAASLLLDHDPLAYRWIYPGVAAIGAAAIVALRFIHVRGDKRLMRQLAQRAELGPISPRARAIEPYDLVAILSPVRPIRRMLDVLRRDREFRVYLTAVFLSGSGNMMIQPVLTLIFVNDLHLKYIWANGLMDVVPTVLLLIAITLWANLYDRIGLLPFRVIGGAVFFAQIAFAGVAAACVHYREALGAYGLPLALGLFCLSRMLNGIGRGSGGIAWNLGHLYFAEPQEAELYMGIHVTLTGLRGMIAPFVGTQLFVWFGWPMFLLAAALSGAGLAIYAATARRHAAMALEGVSPRRAP